MSYLTFVVTIVPGVIGLVAASWLGPNRGVSLGGILMLIVVLFLRLFQITLGPPGSPGSDGRLGAAFGLMRFEWYRWLPFFMVGAAVGSLIYRKRRSGGGRAHRVESGPSASG